MSQHPSEQEKADLAKFHAERNEIMRSAWSGMSHSLRMSPVDLKHSGYSSVEAAVVGMFKFYDAKIEALLKQYLRKYPD